MPPACAKTAPGKKVSVYQPWIDDLVKGKPGSEVIKDMRDYYERCGESKGDVNVCTLKTKVSNVRKAAILALSPSGLHPTYKKSEKALLALRSDTTSQCAERIDDFVNKSTFERAKIVARSSRKDGRKSLCENFSDKKVVDAFAKLRILPANFDTFRINMDEADTCKTTSRRKRLRRKPLDIPDLDAVFDHARQVLKAPEKRRKPEVVLALMLASGRRETEILNGRSRFEPVRGFVHGCLFQGQLKSTKRMNELFFKIPLLVPLADFKRGLTTIRDWQGDVQTLTTKQVSERYQPNLSRETKHAFGGVELPKAHALRSIYMKCVLTLFKWQDMDSRVAKYCLGHATQEQQLSYNYVRLTAEDEAKHRDRLGVFPLTEEELRLVEDESEPA